MIRNTGEYLNYYVELHRSKYKVVKGFYNVRPKKFLEVNSLSIVLLYSLFGLDIELKYNL